MDIKKAIEICKKEATDTWTENKAIAIETVLNELDKKDKIINEMAEQLEKSTEWYYSEFDNFTKQDFIDYFTKKVEGE